MSFHERRSLPFAADERRLIESCIGLTKRTHFLPRFRYLKQLNHIATAIDPFRSITASYQNLHTMYDVMLINHAVV